MVESRKSVPPARDKGQGVPPPSQPGGKVRRRGGRVCESPAIATFGEPRRHAAQSSRGSLAVQSGTRGETQAHQSDRVALSPSHPLTFSPCASEVPGIPIRLGRPNGSFFSGESACLASSREARPEYRRVEVGGLNLTRRVIVVQQSRLRLWLRLNARLQARRSLRNDGPVRWHRRRASYARFRALGESAIGGRLRA